MTEYNAMVEKKALIVKVIAENLWPDVDFETARISNLELLSLSDDPQPPPCPEENTTVYKADVHYCGEYALAYFPESHELVVGLSVEVRRHLRRWRWWGDA